jgi:hypothetical protein
MLKLISERGKRNKHFKHVNTFAQIEFRNLNHIVYHQQSMSKINRDPIGIRATYTDQEGKLVEIQFNSLSQASKYFHITPQSIKELSLGGTPSLPETLSKDLKITRFKIPPKFPKTNNCTGKWHCDICDKDIKSTSKYAHIATVGHLKKQEILSNNKSPIITS